MPEATGSGNSGQSAENPPQKSRFLHLHSASLTRHPTVLMVKKFVAAREWRPCGSAVVAEFAMDGLLWLSGCACNAGSSRRPRRGFDRPRGAIAQSCWARARGRMCRMRSPSLRGPITYATTLNLARSPCPAAEAELARAAARQYPPMPGRGCKTLLPCALCRPIISPGDPRARGDPHRWDEPSSAGQDLAGIQQVLPQGGVVHVLDSAFPINGQGSQGGSAMAQDHEHGLSADRAAGRM